MAETLVTPLVATYGRSPSARACRSAHAYTFVLAVMLGVLVTGSQQPNHAYGDERRPRSEARQEVLRYEVTWNGNQAAHGNIVTTRREGRVNVIVQAVADGALKALLELWSQVQAAFYPKTFKPVWYNFHLKSSLLPTELVDLKFDHRKGLVTVSKQKGGESEQHTEKFESVYDPVTAAFLLRSQEDYSKPMYVDIFDGKDRARLYVTPGGSQNVHVKAGGFNAVRLNLKLVKLSGEREEIGRASLWISDDDSRMPLLLTSSHMVGTVRFELVQVE